MQLIPAIDVLDGRVVRLRQGDYDAVTDYGDDVIATARKYVDQGASLLHLVNLSGAKEASLSSDFLNLVKVLKAQLDISIQVGGGIRSLKDMQDLFATGVDRIVIGSLLFTDPAIVEDAILLYGAQRIVAAVDCRQGEVRISGWQENTGLTVNETLKKVASLGLSNVLITDINCDGMDAGPNLDLYSEVIESFPELNVIASGGVRDRADIISLDTVGCSGTVVGRALLEGNIPLADFANSQLANLPISRSVQVLKTNTLAIRIIPCLDITGGRVVKGVKFQELRDAGDPVELAKRYCEEGADELTFLDITATKDNRDTLVGLVAKVADAVNIPFTVGGGIRTVEDAKRLLEAGADKISVNSAAVKDPDLLTQLADKLGRANVVCAIDARQRGDQWIVLVKGGSEETELDAVKWAQEATERGAGELLVTSFDRDGTKQGFDCALLSAIKERVNVPVIASGGAGSLEDIVEVIEKGQVDAVLAASIFHYGKYSISDVKKALQQASIPVRLPVADD